MGEDAPRLLPRRGHPPGVRGPARRRSRIRPAAPAVPRSPAPAGGAHPGAARRGTVPVRCGPGPLSLGAAADLAGRAASPRSHRDAGLRRPQAPPEARAAGRPRGPRAGGGVERMRPGPGPEGDVATGVLPGSPPGRARASSGSSFHYSFGLLPHDKRRAILAVYAFCRVIDDLADEGPLDPARAEIGLHAYREEIARCYGGAPNLAVTRDLQVCIRRFDIPRQALADLLGGGA